MTSLAMLNEAASAVIGSFFPDDRPYPINPFLVPADVAAALYALRTVLAASGGTLRALEEVAAERRRRIVVEGFGEAHDDEHGDGALAVAAACYASAPDSDDAATFDPPCDWPWDDCWWKPKDRRSNLVRAAALIVAEIERIDREAASG